MAVATAEAPGAAVTAKAIGMSLHRGRFGHRRKSSLEKVSVEQDAQGRETDKALLGLTKTILVSPELREINRIDGETNVFLQARVLGAPLAYNVWAVPLTLVQEVDNAMRGFAQRRGEAADKAATMFPQRLAETRARLGALDDQAYPTVSEFRAAFFIRWEYLMFETPQSLKLISADLFETERAKVAEKLEQVAAECTAAMRFGLQSLVDKMVESLTPGPDGKPKRFHPSVVKHLTTFLATFDARNVTNDTLLAPLAKRAKDILQGVDPVLIQQNVASRPALAARFAEIQAALVPLVGPRRMIGFDEDDEE